MPRSQLSEASDSIELTSRQVRRETAARTHFRAAGPPDPAGTTPFLSSEQAAIVGYQPRGGFQLHWFAADPAIVSSDSALPESAESVIAGVTGTHLRVPTGMVPIPVHPRQARDALDRSSIRQLLDRGLLRDLGTAGAPWYPTSSPHTVYRADSPVMFKLSLDPSVADSRREDPRNALRRGVEMHRLLEAGLGAELATAHPGFGIVRDPAWLAMDLPDHAAPDTRDTGLSVVLRENPFGPKDLVHCVAGLVSEPLGAGPSLLACLVKGLAVRSRRPLSEVAREWFGRYLATVAVPILWLYAEHGIALDAHQLNTLVIVNGGGWPIGGRYRNSDSTVEDAIAEKRLAYHLGAHNLMGLIRAFGSQSLADEQVLLADLRRVLDGASFSEQVQLVQREVVA